MCSCTDSTTLYYILAATCNYTIFTAQHLIIFFFKYMKIPQMCKVLKTNKKVVIFSAISTNAVNNLNVFGIYCSLW